VVVCGKPQFLDGHTDTLLNPTLIVEVLSPSTEAYDRGRKFEHYRSLASLRQYLLVASERTETELRTRQPDGQWLLSFASEAPAVIDLESRFCWSRKFTRALNSTNLLRRRGLRLWHGTGFGTAR
jgi:Uma2 family endonuclease